MKHRKLTSAAAVLLALLTLASGASAAESAEEAEQTEATVTAEETGTEEDAETRPAAEVVTVSRGDFLDALYTLSGAEAESSQDAFTDVPKEGGYAEAVHWAVDNKIVNGYGGGLFGPDDPVTREQAAAMIYRYAQSLDKGFSGMWMFLLDAPDAGDISDYADEAMHWVVMNKILSDTENGLKPQAALADYELVPLLSCVPKALGMDRVYYAFADVGLAAAFDSDVCAKPLEEIFDLKFFADSPRLDVSFQAMNAVDITDMEALRAYVAESTMEDAEFIDKDTEIVVTEVDGVKITVKRA